MNADKERTTTEDGEEQKRTRFTGLHAELTERVLKVFYEVYNELGGGFLESVYQSAFALALKQSGLQALSQVAVPVHFRGEVVGDFRADLIVNGDVLLELKALQTLDRNHEAQVLNYLRATSIEVALLLNFGPKPQFKRFLLDNRQKRIRVYPCESVVKSLEGSNR
jgi:GxxExxY protein